MGRRKIEMQKIKNNNARNVTFCKRKTGLMKKAFELSVLCGVDVGLLMFAPATGKLSLYASKNRSIEELLLQVACVDEARQSDEDPEYIKAIEKINKDNKHLSQHQSRRRPTRDIDILHANLKMIQMKKAYTEFQIQLYQGIGIEKLSLEGLQNFESKLQLSIINTRAFKEQAILEMCMKNHEALRNRRLFYPNPMDGLIIGEFQQAFQAPTYKSSVSSAMVLANQGLCNVRQGHESSLFDTLQECDTPTYGPSVSSTTMLIDQYNNLNYIGQKQSNINNIFSQYCGYVEYEQVNHRLMSIQNCEVDPTGGHMHSRNMLSKDVYDGIDYDDQEDENSTCMNLQDFEAPTHGRGVFGGTVPVDRYDSSNCIVQVQANWMPISLQDCGYVEGQEANQTLTTMQDPTFMPKKDQEYPDCMTPQYTEFLKDEVLIGGSTENGDKHDAFDYFGQQRTFSSIIELELPLQNDSLR
uniref:MADS-box protein LAMB1 n=1 Tax=Spinulum annotinum TaxID=13840 RepID=Q9FYZ8_SPIAN|nr:MADS-box protein LAMB1 [Spinulum annotinum]